MVKKGKKVKEIENQVRSISLIKYAFLGVLFLSPLLRGLYFEAQFYMVTVIIGIIFMLYLRKEQGVLLDKLDLLFLALIGSYAFSIVGAASPRGAYLGFIRSIAYFLSFYFIRNSVITENDKKQLSICFISAISAMTILTILTKAKVISLSNTVINNRFAGTVEYSNTYAVLLAAVLAILFTVSGSAYSSDKKVTKWLSLLSYLNATALYATLSRGGVLIYLFMLTIISILTKEKGRLLANLIIVNTLAVASSVLILRHEGIVVLAIILCGGLLALGLQHINQKISIKVLKVSGGVIGLIPVALIIMNLNKTPLSRLLEVNLSNSGFHIRYIFYRDALKIFLDNRLFGTGAGGWEILYGQYQSFYYTSKLVHSSLVQSLVEVGLIGTSLFLAIAALVVLKFIQRSQKNLLDQAFLLVFLTIFLHSLIDFDLSVPAVPMMMYTAMAAIAHQSEQAIKRKGTIIGLAVLSGLMAVSVIGMGIASLSTKTVMRDGTVDNLSAFKSSMASATILDPLNTDYHTYLGQAYLNEVLQRNDQRLIEESLNHYYKAVKLEPNNYLTYLARGIALQKIGRFDDANTEYAQVIKLRPFHGTGYEYAMKNYLEQAMKNRDKDVLIKVIQIYEKASQQMAEVSTKDMKYLLEGNRLNNMPELNNYIGIAKTLSGDFLKGHEHFTLAKKFANDESVQLTNVWLVAVSKRLNQKVSIPVSADKIKEIEDLITAFVKL